MEGKILIIGAGGQIGTELTKALEFRYGAEHVIATDVAGKGLRKLDATDRAGIEAIVREENVQQIYLLAAMLSATGEKFPEKAWNLNMQSLLIVLEIAREMKLERVFFPSSIAAVTPSSTVYGISKYAGELWCEYYYTKYGVDVRSLRYPGLISYQAPPGGGTTDYAVDIFFKAVADNHYECFLSANSKLPMMYMDDAIRATIELMEAPAETVRLRTSYDIAGCSYSPAEIAAAIRQHLPEFTITYSSGDPRQRIADSWPSEIDDTDARLDWGWEARYGLKEMVKMMLQGVIEKQQPVLA